MENNTICNLGKLYRLLDEACTPDRVNQADLDNATRFPVRGVMMKITLAHKLHKMTPELDNACAYVLKDVDLEDVEKSYALKALPMEQQGLFVIGYNSPDYKTLGVSAVKIKAARESAGLTIRALAEKPGCPLQPFNMQSPERQSRECLPSKRSHPLAALPSLICRGEPHDIAAMRISSGFRAIASSMRGVSSRKRQVQSYNGWSLAGLPCPQK